MTEYRIAFANGVPGTVIIKAAKLNLGAKKLWLYDQQNHLVACYQWEHIVGFDVVGSPEDQLFTDDLLHEGHISAEPARVAAIDQRGLTLVLLEESVEILKQSTEQIRQKWCRLDDEVKKKIQTEALVSKQEGALRSLQAALIEGNADLQKILGLVQYEFKEMGLSAPRMLDESELAPLPGLSTNNKNKKRWFS